MSRTTQNQKSCDPVALAAAGLIVAVYLFGHLGATGFVGPDEPRYAWIARAMALSGDWVTPRLYGQPWLEKPVLCYWAAALGFLIHLPAEWAARLPSAFAALAAALTIGWLGRKHFSSNETEWAFTSTALLAPLIFSTSVAAIGFARAAGPDMLFSAALTLTMAASAAVLSQRQALQSQNHDCSSGCSSEYLLLALVGASLALAMLAKGPVGVLLASGTIGIWALATARWRDALCLAHPVAIAVFCIVALPWYVLCGIRNPDFFRLFFLQHNFERYLTPLFQHQQPFWYFTPILILGLLPWTIGLCPASQEGIKLWREKTWAQSPGFFFACWAFFPVLFFSFSQSKLPGYILPAIPPLALLIAVAFERRIIAASTTKSQASTMSSDRWVLSGIGITWIVMALSAAHWVHKLPEAARENPGRMISYIAYIALAGGIAIALLGFMRKRAALLLSFFLIAFCVELAGERVLPALDPFISARFHGELLRNHRYPNRVFTFHLTRSLKYGLNFYLNREVAEWSPSDQDAALLLTTPQGLEEIRKSGRVEGALGGPYAGVVYVPVLPAPR